MAKDMEWYDWIMIALVIIGAINWGLVGLFNFNLVEKIAGIGTTFTTIIYALVGVSGVVSLFRLFK